MHCVCAPGVTLPSEEEMLELSALLNERLQKSAEASSTASRGFQERGGKTVSYINLFNEMVSGRFDFYPRVGKAGRARKALLTASADCLC